MAHSVCFDNVGKGYDCLCYFFFDCEEALTFFRLESFD